MSSLDVLQQDYKSLLLAASIFAAGYLGSFALVPSHMDGFTGMLAMFGLMAVFGISVLVALVYSLVAVARYGSRSWAVLLAAPILYIGLPMLIGYSSGSYLMQLRRDHYQERISASTWPSSEPMPTVTPAATATAIPRSTAPSSYQPNSALAQTYNHSLQNYRSMRGLVIKSNPDFRNTFTGERQFVTTAINQYSGQAIGIYAVYTSACAARSPNWPAAMRAALMAENMPDGDYRCIGLQLSEPLKVGSAYLGIESTQTGSTVALAQLPKLIDVITNVQPTWLSPQ